ncbi:MAG: phosphotransferase [Ruminococcus sp.]|nr:phosphotransferase [Ruminococcus sp.]
MKLDHVIAERPHKKIYRDGDLVAKVFDESFPKSDVLNEALNQARVEETGLNIPKIEEVTKIDGKWAIISDYIEGKTLKELMDENPDKLDEYMNLFVDVQLKILSKKCPLLKRIKDKMQDKISQADLDATTRYELHTRLASMKKHNKVCHGDFNPSNVIITPDGTPYVLDWSHATQGNGAADAARTYLLFMLSGQKELAEKYLKLYCFKSDTARQYVNNWMPIVAASQSVKGNPEERELLLSWASVFDYQ